MGKVSYNFENEVAVITGAATGIGRETAIQFAKNRSRSRHMRF